MELCDTSDIEDAATGVKSDGVMLPSGFTSTESFKGKKYMHASEIILQVQLATAQDCFDDKVNRLDKITDDFIEAEETKTNSASDTRGHLIHSVARLMSLQHRVLLFSIHI